MNIKFPSEKELRDILKEDAENVDRLLTREQVREELDNIIDLVPGHIDDVDTTDDGHLVIYTGIWRWKDGSYHAKPEPKPVILPSLIEEETCFLCKGLCRRDHD